jgi:putative molybdopterin biosynthesis protein
MGLERPACAGTELTSGCGAGSFWTSARRPRSKPRAGRSHTTLALGAGRAFCFGLGMAAARGVPAEYDGSTMDAQDMRFMNVKQVADYLHLNEKKVYSLVSEGNIPATKVTGKWIFPRDLVDQWLLESSHGGLLTDRLVVTGSDDPLLYRAVMALGLRHEARALVSYTSTGTRLGLSLLARRQADVCALHWGPLTESPQRHHALARQHPQHQDWALVRVCNREQGLMTTRSLRRHYPRLPDLVGAPLRWAMRQEGSGSQRFLLETLARLGMDYEALSARSVATALSEREAASAVAMRKADAAPGTRGAASEFGLEFVHVGWEAFDLALYRGVYFRALFQELIGWYKTPECRALAEEFGGYDLSEVGTLV